MEEPLGLEESQAHFNISYKARVVVVNSFSFCFPGKHFISPSTLNDNLARYSILDSFQHLKCILHSLWTVQLLLRNQPVTYWRGGVPCICLQDCLFILNFCHFNYNLPWFGTLDSSCLELSAPWIWVSCFLPQIREVFSHSFSNILSAHFSSSWDPYHVNIRVLSAVSEVPCTITFFSFCSSD